MTRHRKRDRTNKNTMEICEDRSDESDSYGDDGSDSEVEYGLVSHKIDLLSLSRQSFKAELSDAEHDEIFEYDAEDEYEEPYHDTVKCCIYVLPTEECCLSAFIQHIINIQASACSLD